MFDNPCLNMCTDQNTHNKALFQFKVIVFIFFLLMQMTTTFSCYCRFVFRTVTLPTLRDSVTTLLSLNMLKLMCGNLHTSHTVLNTGKLN